MNGHNKHNDSDPRMGPGNGVRGVDQCGVCESKDDVRDEFSYRGVCWRRGESSSSHGIAALGWRRGSRSGSFHSSSVSSYPFDVAARPVDDYI